jgi:LysM repeat protein
MWRFNLHASVSALAISPILFGWAWGIPLFAPTETSAGVGATRTANSATPVEETAAPAPAVENAGLMLKLLDSDVEARPLVEQIARYPVQRGDTLNELAKRFGISVDTLVWANTMLDSNRLLVGRQLTVLPVSGVLHTVRAGDTLANLAERYGTAADRLAEANGLTEPFALQPGSRFLVPDGRPLPTLAGWTVAWPAPGTGDRAKRQFIEAAAVAGKESYRRTRVPVSVITAQAIHESYWGTSKLAREANNYFGIKARNGQGSAGVYMMDAWEVIGGENVVVPESFRAYNNPAESFVDHGLFFIQNSRYHGAFRYSNDPRAFAQAIADAGYATDPAYAPKLIGIMDQYNLYQYDEQ